MKRDRFAPPPMPEGWPSAPRSMAPTIAKLDSLSTRTASEISSTNRRAGYEEGKRHAYRVVRRWIVGLLICGGIVAWML